MVQAGGGVGQLDMSRNEASDRSSASDDDDETTMHTAVHGMAVGGNDGIGVGLDLYDSEDAETVMLQQHEQDVAERMLATFGAGEADQLLNSLRTLLDNTQARNVRLFVQAPTNNIGLNMGGGLTMGDLSRLTSYTPGVTAGEPTSTVNFIHPLLQPPADLVLSPLSMLTPANAGNGDETFDPMSNMMDSQATMLRWRRHAGLDAGEWWSGFVNRKFAFQLLLVARGVDYIDRTLFANALRLAAEAGVARTHHIYLAQHRLLHN
jgi:hypothetical protein